MKKLPIFCPLIFFLLSNPVHALPRDADAVLNRCGAPLRGDETILENTVAGGRRILHYTRGTLNFDKVATQGWTFTFGQHGKQNHLNADQMGRYMPCLKDALADSASAAPLTPVTSLDRVTTSMKRSLKEIILYSVGLLIVLGAFFALWSRRSSHEEDFAD